MKVLNIATDGSAMNSGANRSAASGIVIGDYARHIKVPSSEILELTSVKDDRMKLRLGEYVKPTNNRGELFAIAVALRYILDNPRDADILRIVTDSQYSIGVCTKPVRSGQPNYDLVVLIKGLIVKILKEYRLRMTWVPSHIEISGKYSDLLKLNSLADQMADYTYTGDKVILMH